MKKIIPLLLIVIFAICAYAFCAITPTITGTEVSIRTNHTDFGKADREVTLSNESFVSDLNTSLGKTLFFRQPLAKFWSRSEFEYEIVVNIGEIPNETIVRILINENETSDTRLGYRNRIDVLYPSENSIRRNFTGRLNDEQVDLIINSLKKHNLY